jgi:hypothetical protein
VVTRHLVYICPDCNKYVRDPEYALNDWFFRPPAFTDIRWHKYSYPVCPCGRRLRHWLIGDLCDSSLFLSMVRTNGIFLAGVAMTLLISASFAQMGRNSGVDANTVFRISVGILASLGLIALITGLLWSGTPGITRKLAFKAYSVAAGFLIPTLLLGTIYLLGEADTVTQWCVQLLQLIPHK